MGGEDELIGPYEGGKNGWIFSEDISSLELGLLCMSLTINRSSKIL